MSQEQHPSFTPYPAYKPSGVEWLGDIPGHLEVRRLKYSAKLVMGQSPSGWDCDEAPIGLPFLQGRAEFGDVHPQPVLYCRAPRKISPAGAILLSVRAPAGRLNFADQEYVIGRGLCAIIPDGASLDTTFAYYHLLALDTGLRLASTGSTYDAVSVGDVGGQPIVMPPIAEQRAIAAHLDRKGDIARRHADVSARLIACLRELRQAEIRQAVTRGLDADAPLRASGVEWMGDVPERWDVRRLKRICRFAYGDSLSSDQRSGGDIPVYGSNGQIDNHSVPNTAGECVIIGRKGSFGKVHYSPKSAFAIDTTFFVDKRYTDANIRWLFYLLGILGLDAVSMDSAVPGLNREYAYSHISPYPPLAEQRAIAAHLDGRMAAIDAAIAHCEREAALVGEYWARLAVDAVTGQVDVRGMV